MVRVREPVASHADVSVTLIDFGRAMAKLGGEDVSAGMVLPNGSRPWFYNPTADTARLLMSMHRSLMASFESHAHGPAACRLEVGSWSAGL